MAVNRTIPPTHLIVAAMDLPGKFSKGDIVETMGAGHTIGDWIAPPKFILATITDKSRNQVSAYLKSWNIIFIHTLLNQNDDGWRFEIAVDPAVISASELNKNEIKQIMADYLERQAISWNSYWYKSAIFGWTASSITIDIPKPSQGNPAYDGLDPEWILYYESDWPGFLRQLEHDFHDKFSEVANVRRYKFNPDSVDSVIANLNGVWEGTHTQALNHIIDKLAE